MLETFQKSNEHIERRLFYTQSILALLLIVVIAVPFILQFIINNNRDIIRELSIEEFHLTGPNALCPGDRLTVTYTLTADGRGVYDEDATWFRVTPPATIISSSTSREVLASTFTRTVYRTWEVPESYIDERTGDEVVLYPGVYRRIFALSSPTRSSVVDVEYVEFTIREDCP